MKKILCLTLVLWCITGFAQENKTIRDLISSNPIHSKYMSAIKWTSDAEGFTTFEKGKNGGIEIVRYEAKNNARSIMVKEDLFINPKTNKHIGVSSFAWDESNTKLLIFTNTKKVWRYHTKGDYWLLDTKTNKLQQLGIGMPESEMMFAKFSPDGTRVGYVVNNNIYSEDVATNEIAKITTDGSNYIVNGTFDWVYEEEFACRDGFRFSPDSKHIAYWQSNTEGTGVFNIINNVDSIYSFVTPFPYPKAGTTNSGVKIGYAPSNGGETTWLGIKGDPRNNYLPRMEFIPNSNEMIIQQMNRKQNTNNIIIANTGSKDVEIIFTDKDAAWLVTNDNIQWLKDNKYFTWESDRNGWRQLYMIEKATGEITPITMNGVDIINQVGLDKKNGYVYYLASPENPTERYLYRTRLFGKDKSEMELLSDKSIIGHNTYNMSSNCKWAIHNFSNATTPTQINMISLPKNKIVRVIESNQEAKEQYQAMGMIDKEFTKVELDEFTLDAWIIKPTNFDKDKKYPVIVYVYGEPGTSTVQNKWTGGDLKYHELAELGYVLVSIDNRGIDLPRGREWRKCIYGEVGYNSAKDQANGIQKLGEIYPYFDMERVGIFGHSGGGSMTLHLMFRFPEIYKTGISQAFVADQRLYDTIYQERFMDTPQNNPEGYKKSSPIHYSKGLEGNLLLIHGTGDDNVHYQNYEVMVNELVKNGKVFWSITYPMRTHSLREGEGTVSHMKKSMETFWKTYLPAGVK